MGFKLQEITAIREWFKDYDFPAAASPAKHMPHPFFFFTTMITRDRSIFCRYIGINPEGWLKYEYDLVYENGSKVVKNSNTTAMSDNDVLQYLENQAGDSEKKQFNDLKEIISKWQK